jgi:hypothetical protein
MQELVGRKLLRFATSFDGSHFFFDSTSTFPTRRRTRYGYRIPEGEVLSAQNLGPALGATVLAIYSVEAEPGGPAKLVIESNPTQSKLERTIIYLVGTGEVPPQLRILEEDDEDFRDIEEDGFRELETSDAGAGEVEVLDTLIARNIFNAAGGEDDFFIIQENDFTRSIFDA